MQARVGKLRVKLRYSFWFLPSLMTVFAAALSFALPWLEDRIATPQISEVIPLEAEGIRAMLGMVASSMITVATTAFSIVIVALQLASGQLGPRLLRNFVRDRSNQVALGVFIGTFVYCLLLMRYFGTGNPPGDLPMIGFMVALLLTLAGVAVLIFFIHHAALSIQKDRVIARVSGELLQSLDLLYPKAIGYPPPMNKEEGARSQRFPGDVLSGWEDAEEIALRESGYIQAVDAARLMRITSEEDLCVYLIKRPGDFVHRGSPVMRVRAPQGIRSGLAKRLADVIVLGIERTQQQDVAFVFDQLVEIAIRALSPGINDSFTAMRCIDRLADALAVVARTAVPSPYRYDSEENLRVLTNPVNFQVLVSLVLYPVAESAAGHTVVVLRLFRAIEEIGAACHARHQRRVLERFAEYLRALADQAPCAYQRAEELDSYHARALGVLK